MKSNGIEKNIARIFSQNYVRHFSGISLDELPVKKEIGAIFGDVRSIYVFYLPHSNGLLDLKKRRAFTAKNSDNTMYLNSIFLRSLKIIYTEIERISLQHPVAGVPVASQEQAGRHETQQEESVCGRPRAKFPDKVRPAL